MSYRKDDIPKVTIERMKIGGKELAEEVSNDILNGKFDLGIEKIAKDIAKRQDNAIAMEFTKCIGELLRKNGVVPKITEYTRDFETENTFETRYGVSINELDFSEHDNQFKERIGFLTRKNEKLFDENQELKQRIAELKSKETETCEKEPISDDCRPSIEWYDNRHQSDCIEINRLNTTIDVLIHKVEYLRQFAGLE